MGGAIVVVMGVSGCGKSTVGRLLAQALDVPYVEGDEFHPPANVRKMAAGIALDDHDRADWLATLSQRIGEAARQGDGLVLTCSALKRSYRDLLRKGSPALRLVHLTGSRELLAERMAQRSGHYMPPSLLDSQLATLEPPAPDERAMSYDAGSSPQAIVAQVMARLDQNEPSEEAPT